MSDFNESAMRSAIEKVRIVFGKETLSDTNRFCGAIMDFMNCNEYTKERSMLIFAVNIGACNRLLQGQQWTASEYSELATTIHQQLMRDYGFHAEESQRISEQILAAIYAALYDGGGICPAHRQSRMRFGPYTWQVLRKMDKQMLLITDTITDVGIPYHDAHEDITWRDSYLRKWLNSTFYGRFTAKQRQRILPMPALGEANLWYGTDAGTSVEDSVSILSISEVVRYFGDSGNLASRPANKWFDIFEGQSCAIDDGFNEMRRATYKGTRTWWWLRSPGASSLRAAYVNTEGLIFLDGEIVFENGGTNRTAICPGVRPVILIRR